MRHYLVICLVLLITWKFCSTEKNAEPFELDENNWKLMLTNEWMVKFYAPWCPACKSLNPTWDKLALRKKDNDFHVGKIDVTKSPALSGRFFVTALPTIFHVYNGEFRQYRGSRDIDSLATFIKEKQWKTIEPVSSWKKPDSIPMTALSYFFKLSHYLKDVNNYLQDDWGLPSWCSYALFAITTIVLGATLGLLLVCAVDFIHPPKTTKLSKIIEEKDADAVELIASDELEDDVGEEIENENDVESHSGSDAEKISQSESEELDNEKQTLEKATGDFIEKNDKTKEESTSSQNIIQRKPKKGE